MAAARLAAFAVLTTLILPAQAFAARLDTIARFTGQADGGAPFAALKPYHGRLYGLTNQGGASGAGTIFAADPRTGNIATIVNFTTSAEGEAASPALAESGGLLYGTSYSGGKSGFGSVWSLNPATDAFATVYSFMGNNDGLGPQSGVIAHGGVLYGTTADGGGARSHAGAVFAVDAASGAETVLHSFGRRAHGGTLPNGLIWYASALYGTTLQGGRSNSGTIFSVDPATGKASLLYQFTGKGDGGGPESSLVFASGRFYGTTAFGGRRGAGTVFSFDPRTATQTPIHVFSGKRDGANPLSGLVVLNGALYGTTAAGGIGTCRFLESSGCGTIFKIDLATGHRQVLYAFSGGADGGTPYAGLAVQGSLLFGSTLVGGASGCNGQGCGTLFRLHP